MKPNKKNNVVFNIFTYACLQIINLFVGLIIPRMILKLYGSEINGIVSTTNSFITYFSYLEAGLGLTLIHSLFNPLSKNDSVTINSILSYSKKKYINISCVYFFLVLVLSFFFPIVNASSELSYFEFFFLIFVIGVYGALDFFSMSKYRVLLTADKKEYVLSIAMIFSQIIRFVIVILIINLNLSIIIIKIVPILTLIIRTLLLKMYIKRKYPDVSYSAPIIENTNEKKQQFHALLLQISISTSVSLPVIIISNVMGYKEANVYSTYFLIVSAVISIVSSLSSGIAPLFGNAFVNKENIDVIEKKFDIYEFIVSFVLTVVFSTTCVMIIPFIKIYTNVVDDVNYIYSEYALLFSIFGCLYSMRIPCTALINAKGLYKENFINNVINLLLQIVLCIVLTALFKICGMLIGLIICCLQRNISFSFVNYKIIFNKCGYRFLMRTVFSIVLIICSYIIAYYYIIPLELSIFEWVFYSIISFCIIFIVYFIFNLLIERKSMKNIFVFLKTK